VKERAFNPSRTLFVRLDFFLALYGFIDKRMILLLFPTVRVLATCHAFASLVVFGNEYFRPPVIAHDWRVIGKYAGFTSEVLPIMSIHTKSFVVLFIKWTKLSFVKIHEEVCVFLHVVNYADLELFGRMGKRAIVSVLTLTQILRVLWTVFGFVFLGMVNRLNSVMWKLTVALFRALVCLKVIAQINCVNGVSTSLEDAILKV
jgi:hypothetical protein